MSRGEATGIRAWLGRATTTLLARVRETTPGQYWTSALALAVALPVLLWGLPPATTIVETTIDLEPLDNPPIAVPPQDPPTDRPILSGPPPPPRGSAPAPPIAFRPPNDIDDGGPTDPPDDPPDQPTGPTVRRPDIILLADAAAGTPGRGDGEMAAAIGAGTVAQVLVADLSAAETCAQAGGARRIVVASRGLPSALVDCLLASGANVLGFDDGGSRIGRTGPVALSTAAGAERALLDLAASGAATGTVGLVGTTDLQPLLEGAFPAAAAAGLSIETAAWLAPDLSGDAAINSAVIDFAGAGVTTVLFAAPADLQRRWLARSTLLLAGAGNIVLDVSDAIFEGVYPPSFDGAAAVTVRQFPFAERTDAHADCQQRWQAAAGITVSDAELARVMLWCQHLAIAQAAVAAADADTSVREALLEISRPSLVTTTLGPFDNDDWGPAPGALVHWSAGCSCWEAG